MEKEKYGEDHDYELDALRERHEKGLDNDECWEPQDEVSSEEGTSAPHLEELIKQLNSPLDIDGEE